MAAKKRAKTRPRRAGAARKARKTGRSDKSYYILMNITITVLFLVLIFSVFVLISISMTGANVLPQGVLALESPNKLFSAEESLAKCLTQKGVVMYGSVWFSHYKNQKRMFGDAFEYIAYVECTENQDVCQEKGITVYPTWIIYGQKYYGEKTPQTLSDLTGCEYA